MGKMLRSSESETFKFQNTDIRGINLLAFVPSDGQDMRSCINMMDSKIHITFDIMGVRKTFYSGALAPLVLDSCFYDSRFDTLNKMDSNGYSAKSDVLEFYPLFIDFCQVLNLRGEDNIHVRIDLGQGFFVNKIGSEYRSKFPDPYMMIEGVKGIGLTKAIPHIETYTLQEGKTIFQQGLGDNVTSIKLIVPYKSCMDLAPNSDNGQATMINNVVLNSTQLSDNFTGTEIFIKKLEVFETEQSALARGICDVIVNEELDNCQVEISFDDTPLLSKAFIVVRKYDSTKSILQKAVNRENKHIVSNASKVINV